MAKEDYKGVDFPSAKGWERQEVYVLNALQELKDSQKEFKVEVQDVKDAVAEVAKNISALHGKFDQYNNFNQRLFNYDAALLEKQKELALTKDRLNTIEKTINELKTRFMVIWGGAIFVITTLSNLAIAAISGGWFSSGS